MIKSGFSSREAIFRMFGIHHGHLSGTSVLFAHYETDGCRTGEAWILLREVKTGRLLCVHATHKEVTNGCFVKNHAGSAGLGTVAFKKASVQSVFLNQWLPEEIDPAVALKISVFNENFRVRRILRKAVRNHHSDLLCPKKSGHPASKLNSLPFSMLMSHISDRLIDGAHFCGTQAAKSYGWIRSLKG